MGGKLRTGPQAAQPGKRPLDRLAGTANKEPVVSVLQRGCRVQSMHVEKVTAKNLKPIIEQMAAENAIMMTDDSSVLESASGGRQHYKVNHSAEEYVRHEGNLCITTNGVEGYFSILKRGVNGVYHHWSKKHLHRYLSEFDFRYNARKTSDGERTELAMKGVDGKRLMLRHSGAASPKNN